MKALENKIPPPIVVLLIGAAMRGAAKVLPAIPIEPGLHLTLTAILGVISLTFGLGGIFGFLFAKTTIDPVQIERASHLVTGGIYRLTRNPMYFGLTGLLTTWAMWLATPWTLLGPLAFALFTHRFQIIPEERVMSAKFGRDYEEYRRRVRRWL